MKTDFTFQPFEAQFLRALSYAYAGGADINECFSTASRIRDGDFTSWYEEWFRLGEALQRQGEQSLAQRHPISARDSFLRASNYYRAAMFFHYKAPIDPKLVRAYECHRDAFQKAIDLFSIPVEKVEIPYENTTLSGYFYRQEQTRPTIIANTGYDGTHQENYFCIVKPALERGYNVLAFDGPGQGSSLIKKKLFMRHDWENVISPVVDFLLSRTDVMPNQIGLIGQSWGGYLCPRAAAFENRLSALIANPGQYNALLRLESLIPQLKELIASDQIDMLNKLAMQRMSDKAIQFMFESKMFVHGIATAGEMIKEWSLYNLTDVAGQIRCPTLVIDSENEMFSKGQAKMLYDALRCEREYLFLSGAAGEHCQMGAISTFYREAFDWMPFVPSERLAGIR